MSGSYVLSGMSTNFFECAICLEKYTNTKTLPCGHTFCGSPGRCMKSLENTLGILCALCQRQNKVKEAGLQTNIFIRDVVEQSRRQNTFEASATSNDSRTDNEAPSTSKATQSSGKIATHANWSRLKIVANSAANAGPIYSVGCAGQYIFASTEHAGSWAIHKYMWFESEAGIELEDMAKNDMDCKWLHVAATQRENGGILVYGATSYIFHIDPDTLKTGRKVSLPSAIQRDIGYIGAWEDYLAISGKGTVVIVRNEQIMCRLDTRMPIYLSLTPTYVVFVTVDDESEDVQGLVYRWRSDNGTVLDKPVCLHDFDECYGTAVSGDTLLAFDVASNRLVRINMSTGERGQMTGDDMIPVCFIRHDLVAGWNSSNEDGLALAVAELS